MHFIKHILTVLFFLLTTSSSFGSTIEDLLNQVESVSSQNNPENLSILYYNIGNAYDSKSNFSEAAKYYKLGLKKLDPHQNKPLYFDVLYSTGNAYKKLSKYDSALEYFYKIVDNTNPSADHSVLADTYNSIGYIYKSLGEYQKSYQFLLDALHYNTLEKDSAGIGKNYYMIGSVFFYQSRFEQALENYQKAQKFYTAINNKTLIFDSYAAIGSVYMRLGDLSKSYDYCTQALEMAKTLDYQLGVAYTLGNLAEVHLMRNEMAKAKKMLEEALRIKEELNDPWGIIGGHLAITNAHLKCKTPKKALPHLEIALNLSEKIGSKTRLMETYKYYEKTYQAIGKYPKAYAYLKNYTELRDSVLSDKTLEEMGQAKKKFEIEKKEGEIALLKSENKVLAHKKEIHQLQTFVFFVSVLVLLISFWFVKSRLTLQKKNNFLLEDKNKEIRSQNNALFEAQKKLVGFNSLLEKNNSELASKNEEIAEKHKLLEKSNQEIEEKNIQLEDSNNEIAAMNQQLKLSNDDLENFAYVASHDLKEPLRMVSSYTNLLTKMYNDKFDDTGREFMFYVSDAAKRMTILLDDLLNYSKIGKGGQMDNLIDVNDVLHMVRSNLTTRLADENGIIEVREENLPTIKSNHTQMVQIFQNVISNALKFRGERDPIVIVDCYVKDGMNVFSIQDNGIGIAPENQKKVFEMFKRLHTKQEYEGTGIGLSTCKKIVAHHNGEIWLESEYGVGTTFFFSIPVMAEQAVEVC